MAHHLQYVDFTGDALYIGDLEDLALLEDLDGDQLVGEEVSSELYFAEGAFAEGLL